MKDIITPFLNGLKTPFVGSQTPEPPEDLKSPLPEHKTSLVNLKPRLLLGKTSFGEFKPPFFGRKISIPLFLGFKSPFPNTKAPDSSASNATSRFAPFSIFKSLKTPFVGSKDPKIAPTPAPVPVPVPVPERLHIPPYHHQIDREVGFYDNGDAFDAFKSSLPNLPGGCRYEEINRRPGFGEPHLLGFPVNVRFQIYGIMTKSVRVRSKKILLSPDRTVNGFWPKNHFMEPEDIFDIIGDLSLACFQLRHEVLTYYCSQFHFHITFNYFCSPIAAPLIHKWLPLFGNKMQYLTVELDFTIVGGCYKNEKFALTHGKREMRWFVKRLALVLQDRSGTLRSLHIMCRRYKGFRPPSQKFPDTIEPIVPEPIASESVASESVVSESVVSESVVSETVVSETVASGSVTSEPRAPKPIVPETSGAKLFPAEHDEDGTLSDSNTPNSSVIAQPSHGGCSHATDETSGQNNTPRKHVPLKYCRSSTTYVLNILPEYFGHRGTPLYHFRLSGFSKGYTRKILGDISAIGAGPPFFITPTVPPWPRDYPEIGPGVATTDGNYLGTVMKFINNGVDANVKKPATGIIAASKMFFKRAFTRMSFARKTPNMEHSEPNTPYPEFDQLSTIDDSDIDSDSETVTGKEKEPEGLGLGIQMPTQQGNQMDTMLIAYAKYMVRIHWSQWNKHPLLSKYEVQKDLDKRLDEPDLPKNPPINEIWAIHSVSTRFGNLFGIKTATRGLEKDPNKPRAHNSMRAAWRMLLTPPVSRRRAPSISVMTVTLPDIQEQLEQINESSLTFDGLFSSPEPQAPAAATGWSRMNGRWALGREHDNPPPLSLHTVGTNSTIYTYASESTLDMALSDPTIPLQSRGHDVVHEQEVDSSSTLYVPEDGSNTPTMAQYSNEEHGQAEELRDFEEEEFDLSQLGLHTVATGSTYSGSTTDGSDILDWPLPNSTPTASAQPTGPAPPVPEVQDGLQQTPTVSSRRTAQFSDNGQLHPMPSAPSRRTIRFSDTVELREASTTTSRPIQFAESDDEQEESQRRPRNTSFSKRQMKKQKATERLENLDSLFHEAGTPAIPRIKKPREEKKRSASVSGGFFSRSKSRQEGEDKFPKSKLRNAVSFTYGTTTRPATPLPKTPVPKKKKLSRFFSRNKDDSDDEDDMSNSVENPFNDPSADGTTGNDTTGHRSRAGTPWNNGDDQQETAEANPLNPFLRSVRSFSSFINPMRLRRSRSTLDSNAQLSEQLDEDSDEDSEDLENEPSVPTVPAAIAPTPEPRGGFFKIFTHRPSKSHMNNTEQTDKLSNEPSEELPNESPLPSVPTPAAPTLGSRSRSFISFKRRPSAAQMTSTEPSIPAASAPTPEQPRKGFFSLLKRSKKKPEKLDAQQIEAMSSNLSLLFSDSSATGRSRWNASAETVATVGGDSEPESESSSSTIRPGTGSNIGSASAAAEMGGSTRAASAAAGTTSNVRVGSASAAPGARSSIRAASPVVGGTSNFAAGYQSQSLGRSFVRAPPGGGSIFGPRGGRRDGRGSLAHLTREERAARERAGREAEAREVREREERERERAVRAGREKGGVRDGGLLGLNRVSAAGYEGEECGEEEYGEDYLEDDEEGEYEEGGWVV
ncbi:hypothetical protein VE03_08639 [Pseudogymnoascus sp. 23342-1-I1]|nr:hypothetical protein VE03_08639 [Pseudogymnoascus sp. 23342-1-I1]